MVILFGYSVWCVCRVGSAARDSAVAAMARRFVDLRRTPRTVRLDGQPDGVCLTEDDGLDLEWGVCDDTRAYESQVWLAAYDPCSSCGVSCRRRDLYRWVTIDEVLINDAGSFRPHFSISNVRDRSLLEEEATKDQKDPKDPNRKTVPDDLGRSVFQYRLFGICHTCTADLQGVLLACNALPANDLTVGDPILVSLRCMTVLCRQVVPANSPTPRAPPH